MRRCANDKHKPMVGECEKCGDVFPCPRACEHLDCMEYKSVCCPVGKRFAEETGGHPEDHPGDCSSD